MTKQETIQVLQSIEDRAIDFPNMTECDWVAIAAAKRHLTEEPVSDDLEAFIKERVKNIPIVLRSGFHELCRQLIRDGAKWQKANIWKSADGDDLPEIDREVIVLTQPYPLENSEYAVSFAHRPNPDGWDGKSVTTGKTEHYMPKTYGKGGWSVPDVKWWLDCLMPKEIEL